MRCEIAGLSALLLVGACADPSSPSVASSSTSPGAVARTNVPASTGPALTWLAPLGSGVATPSTFDAVLAPVVEICLWAGGACNGAPIVRLTTTPVGTDLALSINAAVGQYQADWNLLRTTFTTRKTYRIRVLQGASEIGAVSVDVIRGRWALTRTDGTTAPLASASSIPLRFHVAIPSPVRPGARVSKVDFGTSVNTSLRGRVAQFASAIDAQPVRSDGAYVSTLSGSNLQWIAALDAAGAPLLEAYVDAGATASLDETSTAQALIFQVFGRSLENPVSRQLLADVLASTEYQRILALIRSAQSSNKTYYDEPTLASIVRALERFLPPAPPVPQRMFQTVRLGSALANGAQATLQAGGGTLPTFPISKFTLRAPAPDQIEIQSSSLAAAAVTFADPSGSVIRNETVPNGPSGRVSVNMNSARVKVTLDAQMFQSGTEAFTLNMAAVANIGVQAILIAITGQSGVAELNFGTCFVTAFVSSASDALATGARSGNNQSLAAAISLAIGASVPSVTTCLAGYIIEAGLPAVAAGVILSKAAFATSAFSAAVLLTRQLPFLTDLTALAFNSPMVASSEVCRQADGYYSECVLMLQCAGDLCEAVRDAVDRVLPVFGDQVKATALQTALICAANAAATPAGPIFATSLDDAQRILSGVGPPLGDAADVGSVQRVVDEARRLVVMN